jgi:hypothetical protein
MTHRTIEHIKVKVNGNGYPLRDDMEALLGVTNITKEPLYADYLKPKEFVELLLYSNSPIADRFKDFINTYIDLTEAKEAQVFLDEVYNYNKALDEVYKKDTP